MHIFPDMAILSTWTPSWDSIGEFLSMWSFLSTPANLAPVFSLVIVEQFSVSPYHTLFSWSLAVRALSSMLPKSFREIRNIEEQPSILSVIGMKHDLGLLKVRFRINWYIAWCRGKFIRIDTVLITSFFPHQSYQLIF